MATALLIAAVLEPLGNRRGRAAMDGFGELVEATVDLHGRPLAAALGAECEGPLSRDTGLTVTRILREDSDNYPSRNP